MTNVLIYIAFFIILYLLYTILTWSIHLIKSSDKKKEKKTTTRHTPYVIVAISSIDGQIYSKPDFNHTFTQLTSASNVSYVDISQFSDGYLYGLQTNGHVYKLTNNVLDPITSTVFKESVPPLYINNNKLKINNDPSLPNVSLSMVFFMEDPINTNYYIACDNLGNTYHEKKEYLMNGFMITNYNDPNTTTLEHIVERISTRHSKHSKPRVFYKYYDKIIETHFNVSVTSPSIVSTAITMEPEHVIPQFKCMDFLSNGGIVAVGRDSRMYYKKHLFSFPVYVENNDISLIDICVLPDDSIIGVSAATNQIIHRIDGVHGYWDSDYIVDSCCCKKLCIFKV
jgi:hypothetical protein